MRKKAILGTVPIPFSWAFQRNQPLQSSREGLALNAAAPFSLKRAASNVTVVIRIAGKKGLLKRWLAPFTTRRYIFIRGIGTKQKYTSYYDNISSGFLWENIIRTTIPNPKSPKKPKNPQISSSSFVIVMLFNQAVKRDNQYTISLP